MYREVVLIFEKKRFTTSAFIVFVFSVLNCVRAKRIGKIKLLCKYLKNRPKSRSTLNIGFLKASLFICIYFLAWIYFTYFLYKKCRQSYTFFNTSRFLNDSFLQKWSFKSLFGGDSIAVK